MAVVQAGVSFGLSSEYIEATSHFEQEVIVLIYVEGFDDVSFWNERFKGFKHKFEIKAFCTDHKANGKSTLIHAIENKTIDLGKYLLVAMDSDYDYLLEKSAELYEKDFVFQTYAYSIENLLWDPRRLDSICQTAGNCTHFIGGDDIKNAVINWSKAVYPEFLRYLKGGASESEVFDNVMSSFKLDSVNVDYDGLKFEPFTDQDFSEALAAKGLVEDNVFLFVRGHDLEGALKTLCKHVVESAFDDLKAELYTKHGDKAGQFIAEYVNKRSEPSTLVKLGDIPCELCIPRIKEDITALHTKHFT